MSKIQTKFIADQAVDKDKIHTNVVGNGISGGAGTALSVAPDATGGSNLATVVNVSANGVAVKIDDDTIKENGSNQLSVGANAIGANEIDETDNYTWSGTHDYTTATVSVNTPTQSAHAVTKAYADSLRNGLVVKDNARALANTNQTISGLPSTIDGVTTWLASQRILLVGQTDLSENGLWKVQSGAWTRPDDFAAGSSAAGARVFVDEGSSYQDTVWECSDNSGSDVVGTNDLTFVQRPVGELVGAGTGLTKTGTTVNIGDGSTGNINGIAFSADAIAVAVDDSSVAIVSNVVAIKDLGVATGKLAGTSVTAAKLGSDVAGAGLGGGNGSAIAVDIAGTTAETSVANDDEVLIHDTSAGAVRAMTRANFLAGVGSGETLGQEAHVISSGEDTAGYFTLSQTPSGASNVSAFVIGGIPQVNKQLSPNATPDFDILNSNQFHFNNNGAATGLSGHMAEGDEIVVLYAY